jgi:hypothetical protein
LSSLAREHGIVRGWYGAFVPTVLELSTRSCYFAGYEFARRALVRDADDAGTRALKTFACGGIGGMCNVLAGLPFDTVKSRLMTQDVRVKMMASKQPPPPLYNGVVQCARHILKTEGFFRGLYRGLTPALLRSFPANGAGFFAYEFVMSHA